MPFPALISGNPNVIFNGIGGTPFGTQGSGIYNGYTLVGGDDFTDLQPNMLRVGNPTGKYMNNTIIAPQGRLRSGNPRYNGDPYHTGYNDSNRGVPVGYTGCVVQSSSALSLKCRVATSAESALSNSQANIFAGFISLPYLSFTPPAIIEFKTKWNVKYMTGVHPTIWIRQIDPANVRDGIELDLAEGSSQYPEYNLNIWGTVSGWGPGGTAGTPTYQPAGFTMPSQGFFDGNYHTFTLILDSTGANLYADGSNIGKWNGDATVNGLPFIVFMSIVTYNPAWLGDAGFNQTAFTNGGDAGAVMTNDYYQIWLPNAKANQIIKATQSLPTQQYNYGDSISYTYPSASTLWGAGNFDSDYLQALKIEDIEPGADTTGSITYLQFPTGLSLSGRVLSGTLTGNSKKPGRLHLAAIPTKAGGSLNYTAVGYLDIGPNVTTGTISATAGTSGSYDLYYDCNCGTLLPKTISVTGLPSAFSFDSISTINWTSAAVAGTTSITVTATNSSGQSANSSGAQIVVSGGSNPDSLDGTPVTANSTAQTVVTSTFSTTYSGDILVCAAQVGTGGVGNSVSTITDSSGLTWTRRALQTFESGLREISIWTAPAGSGSAYSGTITATMASAASYSGRIFVAAYSNPNSTVMDANSSNPSTSQNTSSTTSCSTTISTNNAKDILFALMCNNSSVGTLTLPSGFTNTVTGGTSSSLSYKVVTTTQSSLSVSWSWTGTADKNACAVVALQFAS